MKKKKHNKKHEKQAIMFRLYAYSFIMLAITIMSLISTGCFDISLYDLNEKGESSSISLLNSYPISEKKGVNLKPYTFTIKNICSITGKYRIVLSKLSNSDLNSDYMRYTFNKKGGAIIVEPIPKESTTVLDKNTEAIINEKNKPNYIVDNYVLEEGYIRPDEEYSYELRLWLDEKAGNEEMNKIFEAVVSISSIATE